MFNFNTTDNWQNQTIRYTEAGNQANIYWMLISFQVLGSVLWMHYYLWLTELHEVAATMGASFWRWGVKKKKRHTRVSVQPELQPEFDSQRKKRKEGRKAGRERGKGRIEREKVFSYSICQFLWCKYSPWGQFTSY